MKSEEMNMYLKGLGIAVLAMLTLFLIAVTVGEVKSYPMLGDDATADAHVISVTGHGDATGTPDIATFSWTVTETGTTVEAAQNAAATKSNTAIAYLKQNGIADADISNQYYNTNENYTNTPCAQPMMATANGGPMIVQPCSNQTQSGYVTNQTVTVTIRNISSDANKVGQLIAGVGATGVKATDASYSFDDPTALQQQARVAAVADARQQADNIAVALGVKITHVVSYNESDGGYGIAYPMAKTMNAVEASAPVVPVIPNGEQKVSADVTVTYSIR